MFLVVSNLISFLTSDSIARGSLFIIGTKNARSVGWSAGRLVRPSVREVGRQVSNDVSSLVDCIFASEPSLNTSFVSVI